jgi:hypothetical protein
MPLYYCSKQCKRRHRQESHKDRCVCVQINTTLLEIAADTPLGDPERRDAINESAAMVGRLLTTQIRENQERYEESQLVQDGRDLLRGLQAQMVWLRVRERVRSGLQKCDEQ